MQQVEQLADRVDSAISAVQRLDGPAREIAQELRDALEAIHRAGLTTIVQKLRTDPTGTALLYELVDDPVVRALLSLHSIIRLDQPAPPPRRTLLPITPVSRPDASSGSPDAAELDAAERDDHGWIKTRTVDDYDIDAIATVRLVARDGEETDVIVVRTHETVAAYRDECPHQGMPLGGALLDPDAGTLTCPWHGYCFDVESGKCLSAPGVELERLPVRVDDGSVWVNVKP